LNYATQPKIAKKELKPRFLDFKVVQSHECRYPLKLVSSVRYGKQQVCVCLYLSIDAKFVDINRNRAF